MTKRRALEIGLAVGVALGFLVRGTIVQAPVMEVRYPGGAWMTLDDLPAHHFVFPTEGLPPGADVVMCGPPVKGYLITDFRGETLERVGFSTDLRGADFRGTTLREVNFSEARLDGARFEGATYDRRCRWPEGFDPKKHGAKLDD